MRVRVYFYVCEDQVTKAYQIALEFQAHRSDKSHIKSPIPRPTHKDCLWLLLLFFSLIRGRVQIKHIVSVILRLYACENLLIDTIKCASIRMPNTNPNVNSHYIKLCNGN